MSGGCERLDTQSKAEAWLKQYERTREFITKEAESACMRLNEWRTCKAHEIIETACGEELDKPGYRFPYTSPLALGLIHYASIMRDLMGCPYGSAVITGLVGHEQDRIPYRFVLHPDDAGKKALRKVRLDIGDLSLNILVLCSPVIIALAKENQEAEIFVEHLKQLGISATASAPVNHPPGAYDVYKQIKVAKDLPIKFNDSRIEKGAKSFLPKNFHDKYYAKIKLFSKWETRLTDVVDLLVGAKIYSTHPPYESELDKVRSTSAKAQYPFKVAGWAIKQGKAAFAWYAQKHFQFDIAKWCDKYGTPMETIRTIDIQKIATAEGRNLYMTEETLTLINKGGLQRFQGMLDLYQDLELGAKLLAGPVAFVFGAIQLEFQARDMIDSWENGDYKAAMGMGLLYAGGVIGVSCAIVETLGLFGVAWATPYMAALGPWGLVAALLVLIGSAVVWVFSKSDLEMYTLHSFLGDEYGKGSEFKTGPVWAEGTTYPGWANGSDRYRRQLLYLLNLIDSFYVRLCPNEYLNMVPGLSYGAFIKPGYLPPGAKCEVVVVGHYFDNNNNPKDLTSTALIDMSSGDYVVSGDKVENPYIDSVPAGTWGTLRLNHFKVKLKHALDGLVHEKAEVRYGREVTLMSFTVKVRFDFLGEGFRANSKYLEYSNSELFGFDGMKSSLD